MAHFAKLDENNIVVDIVVIDNVDNLNEDGNEDESVGVNFLNNLFGEVSNWKQTSYNNSFRGNYATIDGYYDPTLDEFIPEKILASWVWDSNLRKWVAPIPQPVSENDAFGTPISTYSWDETTTSWIASTQPKVHYGKYDANGNFELMVSIYEMHVLTNGEIDDTLGIEIAVERDGEGDWRRLTTPPE